MKMRCLICDGSEWENVDEHIHRPQGAHICKSCGFVTYDSILNQDAMKEFYRSEKNQYRAAPNVANEYQQERKLHYHSAFLAPLFKEWSDKKKKITAFESGAAYGRFLNWIKRNFPDSEVYGTELTKVMRRVAWHQSKIKLDEEFDSSRKYDFIASYKVAEHIPDVDKELMKYAECLRDDESRVYIGVPQWFGEMSCFGTPNWSMADYYHPNHINMWTRKLFESLLNKCGLEIVERNHTFYDSVYLCKGNKELMKNPIQKEDYKEIISIMEKIKKSNSHYESGNFKAAVETYPCFPDGLMKHYEVNRAQFDKEGFDTIKAYLDHCVKSCPESSLIMNFVGSIYQRYEKYVEALENYNKALEMRPHDASVLLNIGQCFRAMKNYGESAKVCKHVINTSSQMKPEAITWFLHDVAQIPAEWEKDEV